MFSSATYIARRAELCRKIGNGLILIPGNPEASYNYPNNTYHFRQDGTFLYYFGLNLPNFFGVMDAATGEVTLFGDDVTVDDAAEDDEIEIEFYEMPEAIAVEDVTVEEVVSEDAEDDEVEVEFYNMEDLLVNEVIATEELSKKEPEVVSKTVPVEDTYTDDDDDDDDLEFIELD